MSINSVEELHQLTTNLVVKSLPIGSEVETDDIMEIVNNVEEMLGTELDWDIEAFTGWFYTEFGHLYAEAIGDEVYLSPLANAKDSPGSINKGSVTKSMRSVDDDTAYSDEQYKYGFDDKGRPYRPVMEDINRYFDRYDLDGSGSINSAEELLMLSTNLVVSLGLDIEVDMISDRVEDLTSKVNLEEHPLLLDGFAFWLFTNFDFSPHHAPESCGVPSMGGMIDPPTPHSPSKSFVGTDVVLSMNYEKGKVVVDEDELDKMAEIEAMSLPRRMCWNIYTSSPFEPCINTLVIVNCITLAMVDVEDPDSSFNKTLETLEVAFLMIFTIEAAVKLIALTPCSGPNSYFNDNWNIMDFTIVLSGWPSLFMGAQSTTIVRTVRVVKPLRTISHIRELNVILDSLTQSGAKLVPVIGLACFVFMIFGTVGLQLFQGVMNQRCYKVYNQTDTVTGANTTMYALNEDIERLCGGAYNCPGTDMCVLTSFSPNNSISNFNNFGNALLTFYVAITMEGWVDVMYQVQDSYSYVLSTLYFLMIIMLTSMVVMELAKGVIQDKYSKLAIATLEDEELAHMKLRLNQSIMARKIIVHNVLHGKRPLTAAGYIFALKYHWKTATNKFTLDDLIEDPAHPLMKEPNHI